MEGNSSRRCNTRLIFIKLPLFLNITLYHFVIFFFFMMMTHLEKLLISTVSSWCFAIYSTWYTGSRSLCVKDMKFIQLWADSQSQISPKSLLSLHRTFVSLHSTNTQNEPKARSGNTGNITGGEKTEGGVRWIGGCLTSDSLWCFHNNLLQAESLVCELLLWVEHWLFTVPPRFRCGRHKHLRQVGGFVPSVGLIAGIFSCRCCSL